MDFTRGGIRQRFPESVQKNDFLSKKFRFQKPESWTFQILVIAERGAGQLKMRGAVFARAILSPEIDHRADKRKSYHQIKTLIYDKGGV